MERMRLGRELTSCLAATEQALQSERQNSTNLQERVHGLDQSIHEYSEQVEQQQQTIALLVSEKTSLSSAVDRLENTEHCESAIWVADSESLNSNTA